MEKNSSEKNDKKGKTPKEKPFKHPSEKDAHQGHGRIEEDTKIGVQFRGGNQGGGSYKKRNK
jgi:hypothetical protein